MSYQDKYKKVVLVTRENIPWAVEMTGRSQDEIEAELTAAEEADVVCTMDVPKGSGFEAFYAGATDAMHAPFVPKTPCRKMSTRPCVEITLTEAKRFRSGVCIPSTCRRYPQRDQEATSG